MPFHIIFIYKKNIDSLIYNVSDIKLYPTLSILIYTLININSIFLLKYSM